MQSQKTLHTYYMYSFQNYHHLQSKTNNICCSNKLITDIMSLIQQRLVLMDRCLFTPPVSIPRDAIATARRAVSLRQACSFL